MPSSADNYLARFRKVFDYVDAHLDETLNVERLSEVAAFSRFHFHRQFTALFGVGVYRYVQLLRLKRAAYHLALRQDTQIADIALATGYDGPEAFARAFRRNFGQSPSAFRKEPQWQTLHDIYQPLHDMRVGQMSEILRMGEVTIIEFKEIKVAVLEHYGDPRLIGDSIRTFIDWGKQNKLQPRSGASFNLIYNNAADVGPEAFRMDLYYASDMTISPNTQGIVQKKIPNGRCAVLRHVGTDANLERAILHLYSHWFPHSSEEERDFPLYLQRLSYFPDVPEHEAVTDIFLPLK